MKPAVSDSRCPELDVMGFKLASCCTSSERCGLDTGMLGMPGCVDLESASAQVPAMGLITFPAPRACSDADAADAGS